MASAVSAEIGNEAAALYLQGSATTAVGARLGISPSTVTRILKRSGIAVRNMSQAKRRHRVDEAFFESIDSERKAYWLGFVGADGCVLRAPNLPSISGVSIFCAEKDSEHLAKFREHISSSAPIKSVQKGHHRGSRITVCSAKLGESLGQYGVVPNKSLTFAPRLGRIPDELRRHFWRGMVDGDGCISANRSSGYKQHTLFLAGSAGACSCFADWLSGIGASPHTYKRGSISTAGVGSKRDVLLALRELYDGAEVFLDRKKARATAFIEELE